MFCVCSLHMIFFRYFLFKTFFEKKNWSFCYGINNSFRGSALLNSPSVRLSFRRPEISCPMHIFFPLLHLVQPGSYFTNRVPLVKNMQLFWMDLEPCFFVWGYSVNYMKHSCPGHIFSTLAHSGSYLQTVYGQKGVQWPWMIFIG